MSTKTWSHVSPVTGVGPCSAQTPATCRYQDSKHFSSSAAERIKAGRPANFNEHEAMVEHNKIIAKHNMENGLHQEPAPVAPKPKPKPQARTALTVQAPRSAPFPTQHRPAVPQAETLYHMDLGFPKNFVPPAGRKELEYSKHALTAAMDDRYGTIPVLKGVAAIEKLQLIELGVADGKVSKLVYRGHLDEERDMCLVVIPKPAGQKWFVKTVWINMRADQHNTLDESKYTKP